MADDTACWFRQTPPHAQLPNQFTANIAQVPMLSYLLRLIQYPQANLLQEELTQRVKLMGKIQPGVNWYIRTDQKYLEPRDIPQFQEHNFQNVQRKLAQSRVDDHYRLMFDEIVEEVRIGRMNGPFQAPTSWTHRTLSPVEHPDLQLLPIPHAQPYTAQAFSIQQVGSDGKDKIRRGEDWRRSGHNSSRTMQDQAFHHTPEHFASLAL